MHNMFFYLTRVNKQVKYKQLILKVKGYLDQLTLKPDNWPNSSQIDNRLELDCTGFSMKTRTSSAYNSTWCKVLWGKIGFISVDCQIIWARGCAKTNGESENLRRMFIPGVDGPFRRSHSALPAPNDSSLSHFLSHKLSSSWHYRLVSVLCAGTQDSLVLCFVWAVFFPPVVLVVVGVFKNLNNLSCC